MATQIITPAAALQNSMLAVTTKGLVVGPVPVPWYTKTGFGQAPNAVIDLTAIVKQSDISVKTIFVDNSQCMLGVTVTDGVGTTFKIPAGYQGFFPITWFPGCTFGLSVQPILSGYTTAAFSSASAVPASTYVSLYNYEIDQSMWKGPPLRYSVLAQNGDNVLINDQQSNFSNIFDYTNANWGADNIVPIQLFGNPQSPDILLQRGYVTLQPLGVGNSFFGIVQISNGPSATSIPASIPFYYTGGTPSAIVSGHPVADLLLSTQGGATAPELNFSSANGPPTSGTIYCVYDATISFLT